MAEGCLRNDFLCMPVGTEMRVPNFTRLLDDAVKALRSKESAEISSSARSKEVVARSVRDDLEAFRVIAAGHGFAPMIVELAIFNDELLQIAIDPNERVASSYSSDVWRLQFLSVSASYEDFGGNSSLLRAWHRGSRLVVERDKVSTVGERRTYDYAYLWDRLSPKEITGASADAQRFEGQQDPLAVIAVDDLANVMLPISYSLGDDAIRHITEDWRPAQSDTSRCDEADNPEPKSIVHKLMSYFAAAVWYEKSNFTSVLEKTLLLVVPFTRPWLFRTEDPSKHNETPASRPGGGVFLILKVDDELLKDKDLLKTKLTKLSSALDYVVFQAGMLEAQQQRFMTRETDLSLFGHTISAQLRQAETECSRAVEASQAMGSDSKVLTCIQSAHDAVLRLDQASNLARTAVLMRSGRAAPSSFSFSAGFAEFQGKVVERCGLAMGNAVNGISDPARKLAVKNVTYQPIKWPVRDPSLVKTDEKYLEMLINELMRNALRHGDFDVRPQITLEVTCDDKYVYLELINPIRPDQEARQRLKEMLSRKSLSLGITEIETLASTYRVPLPCFDVLDRDFSVKCVVAESTQ